MPGNKKKQLAIATLSTFLLLACGSGGGDSTPDILASGGSGAGNPAGSVAVQSSVKFSDCFVLKPGVRYTMIDGTEVLNVEEPFEGPMRLGTVRFRSNELRDVTTFRLVDDTAVTILGEYEYDTAGNNIYKDLYANYSLPANLQPGQSHTVNVTQTSTGPGGTSTRDFTQTFTFIGFEDITLAGRTLTNVCKLRDDSDPADTHKAYVWHANGYGLVRQAVLTAEGQLVEGTLQQIGTVATAP